MTNIDAYDMDGNRIENEADWNRVFGSQDRILGRTDLSDGKWVSTVWLGVDHRFGRQGPPLIFESMVFPGPDDYTELDMRRYATREEALAGHRELVEKWTAEIERGQD